MLAGAQSLKDNAATQTIPVLEDVSFHFHEGRLRLYVFGLMFKLFDFLTFSRQCQANLWNKILTHQY